MDPTWVIEADVPGLDSEALKAEIRRQGMPVHVVKHRSSAPPPRDLLGSEGVALDACVVLLGTLSVMQHVHLHRRWRPGGWCSFERLRCSTYYAYFGRHLLNGSYTLLPGGEAIRQADRLFETHGRGGKVFVRPDTVWKLFRGEVVSRAAFEGVLEATRFDPTTLVLIGEPREITREWRLVIAGGEVVAASQYALGDELRPERGCPDEVRTFAEKVLREVRWRPDPLFMLDVAESNGELHVLELNSFSCSGLYACDPAPVIAAASETARHVAGV